MAGTWAPWLASGAPLVATTQCISTKQAGGISAAVQGPGRYGSALIYHCEGAVCVGVLSCSCSVSERWAQNLCDFIRITNLTVLSERLILPF